MQFQKWRKIYSCSETFKTQTCDDLEVQVLIDEKIQDKKWVLNI